MSRAWLKMRPRPRKPLVHVALLLLLTLAHTIWTATGGHPAELRTYLANLIFLPVCVLAALIIHRSLQLDPPEIQRAWKLIAAGVLAWGFGQGVYTYLDVTGRQTFPSLADVGYLAFIPLFALGVLRLPRTVRSPAQSIGCLLDVVIITIILIEITWHTYLSDLTRAYGNDDLARVIGLAYPLADLLLVGALLTTILWRPRNLTRFQLTVLTVGMAFFLIADQGFAFLSSRDAYVTGTPLDTFWAWGIVCFALAAYGRPTLPPQPAGLPWPPERYSRLLRSVLPSVGILVAYVTLYVMHATSSGGRDLPDSMVVLTVLVLLRQIVALLDTHDLTTQLTQHAHHDPLTGLLSRYALEGVINHALQEAEQNGKSVGVLFIDLDRMKHLNDWYGHQIGDQAIMEIARRLKNLLRDRDTIARFGGDEFVVVLGNLDNRDGAAVVSERILSTIARPMQLNGDPVYLTASIGVALCPQHAGEAELALHNAYVAVYQAKHRGRNNVHFFDEQLTEELIHEGQIESHLRWALRNDELDLHYQPLVRLSDQHLVGFEALLRWSSKALGSIPPYEAVRVAEERGLIIPLGTWGLERAAWQVRRWRATIRSDVYVSVNVSALQFKQEDFVSEVQRILGANELPGDALMLEITETNLVEDVQGSVQRIQELQQLGVRVALDDFGTGYSSLSYLRELPVDVLKIDRSFLQSIDTRGEAFLQAITNLAHRIGLTVVVEGIETDEQYQLLQKLGGDVGQGYWFARPAPASEIDQRYEVPIVVLMDDAVNTRPASDRSPRDT